MNPNAKVCIVFALVAFYFSPWLGLVLLAVGARLASNGGRKAGTSHGSARLATFQDAKNGGLAESEGLILGRADLLGDAKQAKRLLRLRRFTHLASFAPTGKGKGVSVVTPNTLTYPFSMVIGDLKDGENFKLSAARRRCDLGQRVFRYDPFQTCGAGGDTLNPLDFIDENAPDFIDACRDLAHLLVFRQGTEHEPHWNDKAETLICGFIAYVCVRSPSRKYRNLHSVRELLAIESSFTRVVGTMLQTASHGGVLRTLGGELTWLKERELGSVVSTALRHLSFLASPLVVDFISSTSFDPRVLRGESPASLYLCFSTERAESLPGLYRLVIGCLLRILTAGPANEANPVLFLLDEAASLGRLRPLEQAVTVLRGKGIRLWFIFQSLSQVREIYGDHAATILSNIGTHQYFCINDLETAKAISERIGDTTILQTTDGESVTYSETKPLAFQPKQPGSVSRSKSVNRSEIGRRLLKPEEIQTLPEDTALIFHGNLPVVPATLIRYYDCPELADDATLPPVLPANAKPYGLRRKGWPRHVRIRLALCLLSAVCITLAFSRPPRERSRYQQLREEAERLELEAIHRKDEWERLTKQGNNVRAILKRHPELIEQYRDLLTDPPKPPEVSDSRPLPAGVQEAVEKRLVRRPRYDSRLPSQSGFLIPIK